jgi:hypothetical protein
MEHVQCELVDRAALRRRMNPDLKQFIDERFKHVRRSKGIQAVSDIDDGVVYDDDLLALYTLGQRSRDIEVTKLETTINAQSEVLRRNQQSISIPWWFGLLIALSVAAYFYFSFIYVR